MVGWLRVEELYMYLHIERNPGEKLPEELGGSVQPASQDLHPIYDQTV